MGFSDEGVWPTRCLSDSYRPRHPIGGIAREIPGQVGDDGRATRNENRRHGVPAVGRDDRGRTDDLLNVTQAL